VAAGGGVANGVAYWLDANTLTRDANLTWNGSIMFVGGSRMESKTSINVYTAAVNPASSATGQGLNFGNNGGGDETSWIQAVRNSVAETRTLNLQPLGGTTTMGGWLTFTGAQTLQTSNGILTVIGTGGLTLSTAANTNILLTPNGTGVIQGSSRLEVLNGSILRFFNAANNDWVDLEIPGSGSQRLRINGSVSIQNAGGVNAIIPETDAATSLGTASLRFTALWLSAMTVKSILFAGASGSVSQDNANFQYDSSNGHMSLGRAVSASDKFILQETGAKTSGFVGLTILCRPTSSTASIDRYALLVDSSGTWNGAAAVNYGIYLNAVSGGTTNWAIYNNTAANVYLGTGNVGLGTNVLSYNLHLKASAASLGVESTTSTAEIDMINSVGNKCFMIYTGQDLQIRVFNPSTPAITIIGASPNKIAFFGLTTATYDLSLEGNAARTLALERHTTANTAGNNLILQAGGATAGATNKAGGTLRLNGGVSTGSGTGTIEFWVSQSVAAATSDNSLVKFMTVTEDYLAIKSNTRIYDASITDGNAYVVLSWAADGTWTKVNTAASGSVILSPSGTTLFEAKVSAGSKIGFFGVTPVVQKTAIADASGGATIDAEARTALNALLAGMRAYGLVAT
jgi:hypothetical protein